MKTVPPFGPLTAPILWVGEAPGKQEVFQGKPFVGPSGGMARRTLRWAGIDDDRDVRWTNAVKHNPGTFPASEVGARMLKQYADQLDSEIAEMPNLRVIVACGGPAQSRLTGKTVVSEKGSWSWGIERYHSFVFRYDALPAVYKWGKQIHPCFMPRDVVIIPCLHPAGIMRSKGRDEELNLRRAIDKVRLALKGKLQPYKFNTFIAPQPKTLRTAFDGAKTVYFDTEFDRESKQISWIGLTCDGNNVWGVPWHVDYIAIVNKILADPHSLKCAHNIEADIRALEASGGVLKAGDEPGIFDTMIAYHALHPALGVGLDDAARFYIDDIAQWKDMTSNDPQYNAMDVAYGWCVMQSVLAEARTRPVDPMPEIHARMRMLRETIRMTARGMPVDRAVQAKLRRHVDSSARKLRYKVYLTARDMWDKRVRKAEAALAACEAEIDKLRQPLGCSRHPTFNGLRQPARSCEACRKYHESSSERRNKYSELRKTRTTLLAQVSRWRKGFSANNNEHLRWLLYSPDALKLPVQKERGRTTANRRAIDRLATLRAVQARHKAFSIVLDIKEAQHLHKARSTFIDVPLDDEGIAHPPYKVHGTRTGRLAGGSDKDEKSDNRYSFNPLNIPREWRHMYVAPTGYAFVAADWRNVEGRLTAHFCNDAAYQQVLDGELQGGHKVHAVNAGIIYGIDPSDAKTHRVLLSGQHRKAYDGGKRLTHAWSYGMKPPHMSRTFNISMEEAARIDFKLSEAYPQLVAWRNKLVEDVLGVWEPQPGSRTMRCVKEGRRFIANPFGWQLHFLGIEGSQANEVIAFLPQSTGAALWTRSVPLLAQRFRVFTGTYDSFVLIVPGDAASIRDAVAFMSSVMERPWPELNGKTFPCEVAVGYNWGEWSEENRRGLKEVKG